MIFGSRRGRYVSKHYSLILKNKKKQKQTSQQVTNPAGWLLSIFCYSASHSTVWLSTSSEIKNIGSAINFNHSVIFSW